MPTAFNQEIIETRIFDCIQRVNFRLIGSVIQSWELTEEKVSDPEELRSLAIKTLGECYRELLESYDDVVLFDAGRLRCEAYRASDGEIHFSVLFALAEGNSQNGAQMYLNDEEL